MLLTIYAGAKVTSFDDVGSDPGMAGFVPTEPYQ